VVRIVNYILQRHGTNHHILVTDREEIAVDV